MNVERMPALSSTRIVLDTSALLAWIEGEKGADRVRSVLESSNEVYIPWPVLMETFYITAREGGDAKALRRYAMIKQLPVQFSDQMNEAVLLAAARFKANHTVSIANALIAAYAAQLDAVLLHKDPEYESLSGVVRLEGLPYQDSAR